MEKIIYNKEYGMGRCVHGRQKNQCQTCGTIDRCKHGRITGTCNDCNREKWLHSRHFVD